MSTAETAARLRAEADRLEDEGRALIARASQLRSQAARVSRVGLPEAPDAPSIDDEPTELYAEHVQALDDPTEPPPAPLLRRLIDKFTGE